jgi:hypothetical protein
MVEPFSTDFDHGKMLPVVLILGKDKTWRKRITAAAASFRPGQRQVAVTARLDRKNAVMMRAVHGFVLTNLCRTR